MRARYTACGFGVTSGTMTGQWRPADERDATSDFSLYLEWLRATGLQPDAHPDTLLPDAFGAWLHRYVAEGDPVRGAAIREQIVRRAPKCPDAG